MSHHLEHFDGTTVPVPWAPRTAGGGRIMVSDSTIVGETTANPESLAAIVKPLQPDRSQILHYAWRSTSHRTAANLHIVTGRPGADAPDAGDLLRRPLLRIRCRPVERQRELRLEARTSSGWASWDDATNAWTAAPGARSGPASSPYDDYVVTGCEWDAVGRRARLFVLHAAEGDVLSPRNGPRLQALTHWMPLDTLAYDRNAPVWIVIGASDGAGVAGAWSVEYVGEAWGARIDAWTNQKGSTAGRYDIKHHWGYDLRSGPWLPESRDGVAVGYGPQPYDSHEVQWGSVLQDDDETFAMSYSAMPDRSGRRSIALATARTPDGPWLKSRENPIIPAVPGGELDQLVHSSLVKDLTEPSVARRYKMICTSMDPGLTRHLVLFTAPACTGPWTYQGRLLEPGSDESEMMWSGPPLRIDGRWILFYSTRVGDRPETRMARGDRLEVGGLQPAGLTVLRDGDGGVVMRVTAVQGRTVSVASTAGLHRDQLVLYRAERVVGVGEPSSRWPGRIVDVVAALGAGLSGALLWRRPKDGGVAGTPGISRRRMLSGLGGAAVSLAVLSRRGLRRLFNARREPDRGPSDGTALPFADQYGYSRVRKVLSDTQLELYHSIPGAMAPGDMRTVDSGREALQCVIPAEDGWIWLTTAFSVFGQDQSRRAHFETTIVRRSRSLTEPPRIDWPASPLVLLGRWNNAVSSENIRLAGVPFRD